MSARFHPIKDSLWSDVKLEGASFETKAFFCYLCSNVRQRPSGISRVTDAQLAADTGLSLKRVRTHLSELEKRLLVVRDGAWLLVRGYFANQPKQDRLLVAVREDVARCDSPAILLAWSERYPEYRSYVTGDRLGEGQADGQETVTRPRNVIARQSRAEQFRADQYRAEQFRADGTSGAAESSSSRLGRGATPTPQEQMHELTEKFMAEDPKLGRGAAEHQALREIERQAKERRDQR